MPRAGPIPEDMPCLSPVLSDGSMGSDGWGQAGWKTCPKGWLQQPWLGGLGCVRGGWSRPLQQDTALDFEPSVGGPGRGHELQAAMCLGELWWVLLLIHPMPVLCPGTCSWPPLETAQMGRWSGLERLSYVCMLSFIFSSMHVPQALQNVSNLAHGNRISSSLPLFITVNREKAFNVEKLLFP